MKRFLTTSLLLIMVLGICLVGFNVIVEKESAIASEHEASEKDDEWMDLLGWERINGSATFKIEDDVIVGLTEPGSPNSFLCTKKHYSDFILEFDVMVDSRLNSGVQIRSNSFKDYRNYRVHGYQVEIATNGNAGFIYDEARRGWLSTEESRSDEKKRDAFKDGEWNHYKVLCEGSTIKTWVNGVPVAHIEDDMTESGFIGLQVHGFNGEHPAWVKWKNLKLREL